MINVKVNNNHKIMTSYKKSQSINIVTLFNSIQGLPTQVYHVILLNFLLCNLATKLPLYNVHSSKFKVLLHMHTFEHRHFN